MKKLTLFALISLIVFGPLIATAEDDHYARGIVIQSLVPNKLNVGGAEFKTKNNSKGDGVFVFDPRTEFHGTKKNLIWIVIKDEAYPLNGQSKMITPDLKWPREANSDIWKKTGVSPYDATEAIAIVFGQH